MDRPGVRQVPEGSRGQGKMEETGCEVIFGAPTTLVDDDDDPAVVLLTTVSATLQDALKNGLGKAVAARHT